MPKLGVNIDHIATVRQARRESEPDLLAAIPLIEKAGADSIVCHLREDRRHIQDKDVYLIRKRATKPLNLEMSLSNEIIQIALKVNPDYAMFVPEKRQEVTTEGGLDVCRYAKRLEAARKKLAQKKIQMSIFLDPVQKQIKQAAEVGASIIELHTGSYANAKTKASQRRELEKIKRAAHFADRLGLTVHAGHGLKYHNTKPIARIKEIDELNIGHAIISRALFVGLPKAVREMKALVRG